MAILLHTKMTNTCPLKDTHIHCWKTVHLVYNALIHTSVFSSYQCILPLGTSSLGRCVVYIGLCMYVLIVDCKWGFPWHDIRFCTGSCNECRWLDLFQTNSWLTYRSYKATLMVKSTSQNKKGTTGILDNGMVNISFPCRRVESICQL